MEHGWLGARGRDGGIDEIPLPTEDGSHGRLFLCGKHVVGPDPEAALVRAGADTIVCLNERHELDDRYPEYVAWLRQHQGERAVWFPVPDLHAPTVDQAVELLTDLQHRLTLRRNLLVHCGAGIGRAGTVATGILMRLGMSAPDALHHVGAHRPMAGPEAGVQRELVAELERRRTGAPDPFTDFGEGASTR